MSIVTQVSHTIQWVAGTGDSPLRKKEGGWCWRLKLWKAFEIPENQLDETQAVAISVI